MLASFVTNLVRRRLVIALLLGGSLFVTRPVFAQTEKAAPPAAPVVTPPSGSLPPAPDWTTLRNTYAYTPQKTAGTVTEEVRNDPEYADFVLTHIAFKNTSGQNVPGLFLRPKGNGTYPVVLLLHGLTSNKEAMVKGFGRQLAKMGFASLALDADLHGERKREGQSPVNPLAFAGVMRGSIVEYRMALDYLTTRKEIDTSLVGLIGYSMGSFMGAILSGVDDRVGATVLCVGGDPIRPYLTSAPESQRPLIEAISPSNYVGHISPRPVFMINGTKDQTVNAEASKRLQEAAKEPKQILMVESGHLLPVDATTKGVNWLVERLTKKA